MSELEPLERIYANRFDDADAARKERIWVEIARHLQRYVDPHGAVLDLACDRGHFIKAIDAREKWATDARDVSASLGADVRFVQGDGLALAGLLPHEHFDVIFMSNYLEHLPSGDAVVEQFRVARELLRGGGRVVVLQPNIKLVGNRYWDFVDHKVALTEASLLEAADLAGLTHERTVRRFLPYTTKSRFPQSPALVRAYLAFPPLWRLLGKQTLFIARR